MQRAAAATMPTTIPVVLLLSRTTSDGTGNTSGRGGRAARQTMSHHSFTACIYSFVLQARLTVAGLEHEDTMRRHDELFDVLFA